MNNEIRMHTFERRVFFGYDVADGSRDVVFVCEDLPEYQIKINKATFRARDHACAVPAKAFKKGQNHVEVIVDGAVPLVSVEPIERIGRHIIPGGINGKRFVLDLCRRVQTAERKVDELAKAVAELRAAQTPDDIFDIG